MNQFPTLKALPLPLEFGQLLYSVLHILPIPEGWGWFARQGAASPTQQDSSKDPLHLRARRRKRCLYFFGLIV